MAALNLQNTIYEAEKLSNQTKKICYEVRAIAINNKLTPQEKLNKISKLKLNWVKIGEMLIQLGESDLKL